MSPCTPPQGLRYAWPAGGEGLPSHDKGPRHARPFGRVQGKALPGGLGARSPQKRPGKPYSFSCSMTHLRMRSAAGPMGLRPFSTWER